MAPKRLPRLPPAPVAGAARRNTPPLPAEEKHGIILLQPHLNKKGRIHMKKYFSGPALLCALLAFLLFVVAACATYYWTAGVFVTARLALLYVVLGAAGALALLLRRVWFAFFFYIGCALGWAAGQFVGALEGDFAPTAGLICTFFLMAVFAFIGAWLEWKRFRHRRRKEKDRRERQQQEDEARERALLAQQQAKAAAAQPPAPGDAGAEPGAGTQEPPRT